MNTSQTPLYENGQFIVTPSYLRTAKVFYPIRETSGRIRKDFLFAGLAFAAVIGLALWTYYDLWYWHERVAMGVSIAMALIAGTQVSTLQIDARGFPSRMFMARAKTIRAVFHAITEAKSMTAQSQEVYGDAGDGTEQASEGA